MIRDPLSRALAHVPTFTQPMPAPCDPVLLELVGANLREALASGSMGAQRRLGRVIGEYLTKEGEW